MGLLKRMWMWRLSADGLRIVSETTEKTRENRSSMVQDIESGKKTEIDYMNGAIVARAKPFNIPTPVNEAVWRLVRELEVSRKFLTPGGPGDILLTSKT